MLSMSIMFSLYPNLDALNCILNITVDNKTLLYMYQVVFEKKCDRNCLLKNEDY